MAKANRNIEFFFSTVHFRCSVALPECTLFSRAYIKNASCVTQLSSKPIMAEAETPPEIRNFIHSRFARKIPGYEKLGQFAISERKVLKLLKLVIETQKWSIETTGDYIAGIEVNDILFNPDTADFKLLIEMDHIKYLPSEMRSRYNFPHLARVLPTDCTLVFGDDDVIAGSLVRLVICALTGGLCYFRDMKWIHSNLALPGKNRELQFGMLGQTVLCWSTMHSYMIPCWKKMYELLNKLPEISNNSAVKTSRDSSSEDEALELVKRMKI